MFDFVGDGTAIRRMQTRQHFRHGVSGDFHTQDRGWNRRHQRGREPDGARIEGRIADRFAAQGIELRRKVAMRTMCFHECHCSRNGGQQLVGGRLLRHARRGRRDGLRRAESEFTEDGVVEAVGTTQERFQAAQEFTRLRALDHTVIVGAGQRHHFLHAELRYDIVGEYSESRRIADRSGRDDRGLAGHQARNRG